MQENEWGAYAAKIEAHVYPTEDGGLVMSAVRNIFPGEDYIMEQDTIHGEASLSNLRDMLQQQRTRDTARSYMLSHVGPSLEFQLSKQAAAAGYANLVESPGPLGEIRVEIGCSQETVMEVIDWLTGWQKAEAEE